MANHPQWNAIHPGDKKATVDYCVSQFIAIANSSMKKQGAFYVALSGGSTPHAIFEQLARPELASQVDWSKVWLFWSDERSVPPTDSQSNYGMAMKSGLSTLPIPKKQISRMEAETKIEQHAAAYEKKIQETVPECRFDLIMLGMGPDGHTASLFPGTNALEEEERLVVANFVPQLKSWRMTFTYPLINRAHHISIYLLGEAKRPVMEKVWKGPYEPALLPIQAVGTAERPALWITDFPLV